MQHLRSSIQLARFVLVWFALSLGVAIASPIVQPKSMELVCSSSGSVKMLVKTSDGEMQEASSHTLDCPLCMTHGAPPSHCVISLAQAQPLGRVLQSIPAAQLASLVGAPLPARGPPL